MKDCEVIITAPAAKPKVQQKKQAKLVVTPEKKAPAAKQKKSGLIKLKPGEKLFNENDPAQSLYIIQKGQIRLFRPKGKGFVELAVLRVGEVLGEMAYFDDQGGRRSCSAEAIVPTDIIEVSFAAFGKAIENLNPWFKTIITTLADRLRKTNAKVKELESNNVAGSYGQGVAGYVFFRNLDIIRLLSTFFLVFRSQGELKDKALTLHLNTLNFYALEIFNLQEAKLEEFITLLKDLGYLQVLPDKDGFPKLLSMLNVQVLKTLLLFLNAERNTADEKKLKISDRCQMILGEILKAINEQKLKGEKVEVNLSPIFANFKAKNIIADEEDLDDAVKQGLVGEPMVGEGNQITCAVNVKSLKDRYPCIQFVNAINKINSIKAGGS